MKQILLKFTPRKAFTKSWLSNHPWLKGSETYRKSYEYKKLTKKAYNQDPTPENCEIYKRACNSNSDIYVIERERFLLKVMDESSGSTKEFYELLKSNSKPKNSTPDVMFYNGNYVKGKEKLSAFASQLSSSFLKDPPSLGDTPYDITNSLFDIYQTNFTDNHLNLWENFDPKISTETVVKMINELNPKKDPGPMGIPAMFLQHNVTKIAPIIRNAINTMILTGNIPKDWMQSFLTPIPKKGSAIDIENYRGIAMQSCLPKILDKHITTLLYEHLGDIISSSQHGFRKGKSTTTNLIELTQFLHENIKSSQIDVIYFDFSKAFDQIRHDILARKLSELSMPYTFYRLIMKFIIGRTYILKVDGIATDIELQAKSSVPQGSHFGPILYILFTNNMGINALCYADDTKIYRIIKNMDDRNELQQNITKLEKWSEENGLTLNPKKTFHVSYGKKRAISSMYFLKGQLIQETNIVKDLGIFFDKELTFKHHIEHLSKRAQQMIGAARRFVHGISNPFMIAKIYRIYIQPIFEYGAIIWNQHRLTANGALNLAHKKITRIALGIYYTMDPDRYIQYEKRCEILKQDGPTIRRYQQAAIFCIKILKGEITLTFGDKIIQHLRNNENARIRHLFTNTDKNISKQSPLAMLLGATSRYERVIDLSQSTSTISRKIKEFNDEERARIADSRPRRLRT